MKNNIFNNKKLSIAILIGNLIGAIYGFYWYKDQLFNVPIKYWLFVPDCPFFAFLFVIVILGFLFNRRNNTLEVITWIGLLKYGQWTVVTLLFFGLLNPGRINSDDYILIIFHVLMVVEGVILTSYLVVNNRNFIIATFVFLVQDFMDWYNKSLCIYPNLPFIDKNVYEVTNEYYYILVRNESVLATILILILLYAIYIRQSMNRKEVEAG